MHELGVTFKIIDDLKEVANENELVEIQKVVICLGEVSTVIPEYLHDCWKWARKREPLLENCELEIEPIKAITMCGDCKKTYETVKYAKICPYCKSENTWLVSGNQMMIKEIEVPEPQEQSM
ncbi:MAG: hydrogenase maturation nickel metallochaperone HypA [Lachnospiraceae bacterium]|nr:hydrogenase maturation nickel metallochaperone HypA [Lachnospiraceae bacterium]